MTQECRECTICTEPVIHVKVLPCDHTMCQLCLEKISMKTSISCPECREKFQFDPIKGPLNSFRTKYFGKVLCEICSTQKPTEDILICTQRISTICSTCQLRNHSKSNATHEILFWDSKEFTDYLISSLEKLKLDPASIDSWRAQNSAVIKKEITDFAQKVAEEIELHLQQQMNTNAAWADQIREKIFKISEHGSKETIPTVNKIGEPYLNPEKFTRLLNKFAKLTQLNPTPKDFNYELSFAKINSMPSTIARLIVSDATFNPINLEQGSHTLPENPSALPAESSASIKSDPSVTTLSIGIDTEIIGISAASKSIIAVYSAKIMEIWDTKTSSLFKRIQAPRGEFEQVVVCHDTKPVCCFTTTTLTVKTSFNQRFWHTDPLSEDEIVEEIQSATRIFQALHLDDFNLDITQTGALFAYTTSRTPAHGSSIFHAFRGIDYTSNICWTEFQWHTHTNHGEKCFFKATSPIVDGSRYTGFAIYSKGEPCIKIYDKQSCKISIPTDKSGVLKGVIFGNVHYAIHWYIESIVIQQNKKYQQLFFNQELLEIIRASKIHRFSFLHEKIVLICILQNKSLAVFDVLPLCCKSKSFKK